jgi:hypothetical protein
MERVTASEKLKKYADFIVNFSNMLEDIEKNILPKYKIFVAGQWVDSMNSIKVAFAPIDEHPE